MRLYTRISKEVKDGRKSERRQRASLKKYAKRHGIKVLGTHREKQR